jgi:short subunit dehydrogenase-like uncharacterized protein
MTAAPSWMLYGAAGHTGALIAKRAHERGHRPLLAGRSGPALATLADSLGLPHRVIALDDPAALRGALADVDLVLNAAGPFLRTATLLAEACIDAGAHYLDIGNELQVFLSLYGLHPRAEKAKVTLIPGVGFGVVATNCLARYVTEKVGGAVRLEVASKAAIAEQGPGAAAARRENLPYGGWVRKAGQLQANPLGAGMTTLSLPDGPCRAMPVPTGDLEAAFRATHASDIVAYAPVPEAPTPNPPASSQGAARAPVFRSFGWARATSAKGSTAEAWLETGESYGFTAAASVRAVEATLESAPRGAFSPAEVFGADFPLSLSGTSRVESLTADRAVLVPLIAPPDAKGRTTPEPMGG